MEEEMMNIINAGTQQYGDQFVNLQDNEEQRTPPAQDNASEVY